MAQVYGKARAKFVGRKVSGFVQRCDEVEPAAIVVFARREPPVVIDLTVFRRIDTTSSIETRRPAGRPQHVLLQNFCTHCRCSGRNSEEMRGRRSQQWPRGRTCIAISQEKSSISARTICLLKQASTTGRYGVNHFAMTAPGRTLPVRGRPD